MHVYLHSNTVAALEHTVGSAILIKEMFQDSL